MRNLYNIKEQFMRMIFIESIIIVQSWQGLPNPKHKTKIFFLSFKLCAGTNAQWIFFHFIEKWNFLEKENYKELSGNKNTTVYFFICKPNFDNKTYILYLYLLR